MIFKKFRILILFFILAQIIIKIHANKDEIENINDDSQTSETASFKKIFKEMLWTEVYFQGKYSSKDRDNTIIEPWIKEGLHLFNINDKPLDLYFKQSLFLDTNGDYWNNRYGYGIGVRYKPFEKYGLILYSEAIRFHYTGREGRDKNKDESPYNDIQSGAAFWQHWGKELYQMKNNEYLFYLPGTGWRELYADSLYFSHEKNWVSTLDYKEGFFISNLRPVGIEAYLSFEVAIDTKQEYWNNYYKAGPGVRFTPFKDFDLKLSFEYLWGGYYRGSDKPKETFSDSIIQLALWLEF